MTPIYTGSESAESSYATGDGATSPNGPHLGGGLGPINDLYNHVNAAVAGSNRSHSSSSSGSGERVTPNGGVAGGPLRANPGPPEPLSPVGPLSVVSNGGGMIAPSSIPNFGGTPSGLHHHQPLLHPYSGLTMGKFAPPTHITPMSMGRRYSCKLCAAMFDSKAELQIHTQVHMREAKPYKCTHCIKSFANSSYLSQHMRIHLGIKPFGPCQYCGRKFTQLSHLQQHLRTHTGAKPYKCSYTGCEKAFSQLSNLQSHSRCHQTDKPFKCNSCYKCFSSEDMLLEHIPKHRESKHLKIHICPFCGKSYTQATYLAKHMTKHADKRDSLRMREMNLMRDDQLWSPRDACPVHGVPDSCADVAPSTPLHYSFTSNMMPSQTCAYTGGGGGDPSAFTRFNMNAFSALGRNFAAPPANRTPYFSYDNFNKTPHPAAGLAAHTNGTPFHSQLISLDNIRQYAGQAATSAAAEFSNMLGAVAKRDF